MILNKTELLMQRRQTQGMINADFEWVVLTRTTRVKTPAGGWVVTGTEVLPSQKMQWVTAGLPQTSQSLGEGGQTVNTVDQLIAVWNADLEVKDTFTHEDQVYEVYEISVTEYRKVANVRLRGNRV